jgi:hypothetical protein
MVGAVVVDPDGVYDPAVINDRLLLGLGRLRKLPTAGFRMPFKWFSPR